jgi:hypothetical protein
LQSTRPGFKPSWILSSRSGLDSAILPHHTYIQASNLRFGNRMEIEEVLQVEKNLATDQRTRRRRSRFVVQGGLGRCIKSLSFTLWIYEKQKNKVLYRNQIASSPRLGNALGS